MQTIKLPDKTARPRVLGFSAAGRWLAAWDYGEVYVLDTAGGTVRAAWGERIRPKYSVGGAGDVSAVPGVGFTPDGRVIAGRLIYGSLDGAKFHVHDADTGEVRRALPAGDVRGGEVAPDGRAVYLAFYGRGIVRCDPLTGKCSEVFGKHGEWTRHLAVSADGRWLAGVTHLVPNTVRVWNLGGKKLPARATKQFKFNPGDRHSAVTISGDGAFVAYTRPGVNVLDVGTGDVWRVAADSGKLCRDVAFHPARPVLAYSGGTDEVTFHDAAARTELRRYAWKAGPVGALAFSPDGLRCAAAGVGKVVIWDVDA